MLFYKSYNQLKQPPFYHLFRFSAMLGLILQMYVCQPEESYEREYI